MRDIDVGETQGLEVTAEMTSGQSVKGGEERLKQSRAKNLGTKTLVSKGQFPGMIYTQS